MTRILFVCLGNICRSPTALAVFRKHAADAGLAVAADSCGTSDWHLGQPPYLPSIEAGLRRGYDLRGLRVRQITAQDFSDFSHILVMDRANLLDTLALRPTSGTEPQLLMDYAPPDLRRDIPDPWHSRDFEGTLDLIETAITGLIAALRPAQQTPA